MLSMLGANSASRKNLGRILVAKKVITPETLQRADEDGCDGDDKLFGYLLENRLADERQILVAVGQVLGFPAYSAADYHPSPELAQVIPADFSYKYHVVRVQGREHEVARQRGLPEDGVYWRGKGCPHCGGTGYTGRMGIFEFFEVDDDAAEAISGGVTLQQLWRQSQQRGSHSMSDDVRRKILDGRTTVEEATRVMLV